VGVVLAVVCEFEFDSVAVAVVGSECPLRSRKLELELVHAGESKRVVYE
jgi:hypothetical protein